MQDRDESPSEANPKYHFTQAAVKTALYMFAMQPPMIIDYPTEFLMITFKKGRVESGMKILKRVNTHFVIIDLFYTLVFGTQRSANQCMLEIQSLSHNNLTL